MNVRRATREDVPLLRKLLAAYVGDLSAVGGELLPTQRTLDFFVGLALHYIEEPDSGVVLLCGDVGMTMAGDARLPYDTTLGRAAMGWGTLVAAEARRLGIATMLRRCLVHELRERGFETLLGGVNTENEAARASMEQWGWTVYQFSGFVRLSEV